MSGRKRYEDLTFADDFMFCKVLENNQELCKQLIELIIGDKIGKIAEIQQQKSFEAGFDARGVRFDVHLKDESSRIYDIEMQTYQEKDWEKRSRFYSSNMDIEQLEKGRKISELKDTWVIFICDFQISGYNLAKYTFRKVCEQRSDFVLNDGTHLVMLCTDNNDDTVSTDLQHFLTYVSGGLPQDDLTRRLQDAVNIGRISKNWRREYMLFSEYVDKERAEGRAEGRAEAQNMYVDACLSKKMQSSAIISQLVDIFHMSEGSAKQLVNERKRLASDVLHASAGSQQQT